MRVLERDRSVLKLFLKHPCAVFEVSPSNIREKQAWAESGLDLDPSPK